MPLKHTVEEIVLKNGARGLLIDVPDATVVAYDVYFRAGNDYVARKEVQQTAHLMEHMAFGGTKRLPSQELFSQEFTKNGAYHNAYTYPISMVYVVDAALLEWKRILALQQEAITEPLFTQTILDAEKGNVTEELTGQANNHGRVLWQHMKRALGNESFLDTEKLATVEAVTLDDIHEHYKRTHTARNMRFCITGNLAEHRGEIIDMLESWNLPEGELFAIPRLTYKSAAPVYLYRKELPSIIFGFNIGLNRKLTDAELDAMSALNHILTGTHHSRILGTARAQGICYGMGSDITADSNQTSMWDFSGQIRPQNVKALYELIAKELQKVRDEGVSEAELEAAKLYALGSHQMTAQTVRSVGGWYSGYYADTGKIVPIDQSPKDIKAVTTKMIQSLTQEFLEHGQWVVGIIGDVPESTATELNEIVAPLFSRGVK